MIVHQKNNKDNRNKKYVKQLRAVWSLILTLFSGLCAAQSPAIDVESTRSALEQWVEIERTISKEKKDLDLSSEVLAQRIEMVKQEISGIREKIDEAQANRNEAEEKRQEMSTEKERLTEASSSLEDLIESLEMRTGKLIVRLPVPLQERIKPLSQRLPEPDVEIKVTLAERFQNVVGILNEINKFHRDIFVTSEVRELPDGTSTEVTTVYLGISHAFYCDVKLGVAGVGSASDTGWKWTPTNESAPAISQAIGILSNEQVASYVRLPLSVK